MSRQPDPFHLIQIANPVPDPDRMPDGPESASAQAMIEEIIGMTTQETIFRPTRRRLTLTVAVAGMLVASVAAAWALTRPEATTSIQCPGNSIIAAVSGDPIEDCTNELNRQGAEVGTMAAYVNERGGVVVVEVGSEIPSDWQPLADDFRQDTAIIELEASLGDVATGLAARCYLSDEAVPIIERELARLGLPWSVEVDGDQADGAVTCAYGFVEPEEQLVRVRAVEAPGFEGDEPWVVLGAGLNEVLGDQCLTLDEAATQVPGIAREAGLDPEVQLRISTSVDNDADCTRATVTVGGVIFVDLRGPQGN